MLCGMWDLNFPNRDGTQVPCIGRWFLNHWTTREVPQLGLEKWKREAEDKPASKGCYDRWTQLVVNMKGAGKAVQSPAAEKARDWILLQASGRNAASQYLELTQRDHSRVLTTEL